MIEWFQKGGPVMIPLLVCSIVSLTFIVERLLFWFLDQLVSLTSLFPMRQRLPDMQWIYEGHVMPGRSFARTPFC